MKVYQKLANLVHAVANTINSGNKQWQDRHEDAIARIMQTAPRGSGIDCGTKFDIDNQITILKDFKVKPRETLAFFVEFHHMDGNGMYDGWTQHTITVHPSLLFGFTMTISGRDRNQIKDYLSEVYHHWLTSEWEDKQ